MRVVRMRFNAARGLSLRANTIAICLLCLSLNVLPKLAHPAPVTVRINSGELAEEPLAAGGADA